MKNVEKTTDKELIRWNTLFRHLKSLQVKENIQFYLPDTIDDLIKNYQQAEEVKQKQIKENLEQARIRGVLEAEYRRETAEVRQNFKEHGPVFGSYEDVSWRLGLGEQVPGSSLSHLRPLANVTVRLHPENNLVIFFSSKSGYARYMEMLRENAETREWNRLNAPVFHGLPHNETAIMCERTATWILNVETIHKTIEAKRREFLTEFETLPIVERWASLEAPIPVTKYKPLVFFKFAKQEKPKKSEKKNRWRK